MGYETHGTQEVIQDFKCHARGKKFTVRRNTILYRLKSHSGLIEKIVWLLALGVDASALEEVFGVQARSGLYHAFTENVEELQTKNPQIRINLDLGDNLNSLPDDITLALYRIYQQAMNNIDRHAKASEVWVRLKIDPKQILFEIQDNGLGIADLLDWDEYARKGHLGLIGMKERAEAIGGAIQIISGSGEGTLVQVSIPVHRIAPLEANNLYNG